MAIDTDSASNVSAINVVEFSHHDLAYGELSHKAEVVRVNWEIDCALDFMQSHPDFSWTLEYAIFLYSYLRDHPERSQELALRVAEGRFTIGSGYTQPQTSFLTAEMLVRQFIYGKKYVERVFPGYKAEVYCNTDIPGLGTQMPQILSQAGVKMMLLCRSWNFDHIKSHTFGQWEAPDGSRVYVYFMDHYGHWFSSNFNNTGHIRACLQSYAEDRIRLGLGSEFIMVKGQDSRAPENLSVKFDEWNKAALTNGLPTMRYASLQNAFQSVFSDAKKTFDRSDTFTGEWPNLWVYETGASDYDAFLRQRKAERLLRASETLNVYRGVLTGDFSKYPFDKLEEAWRKIEFTCHGYAGYGGIEEFRNAYRSAEEIGLSLFKESLGWLAAQIQTNRKCGIPVVVYNELSWSRSDCVFVDCPKEIDGEFSVVDRNGIETPCQWTSDGRIVFAAKDVPSLGYKTYYLRREKSSTDTAHEYLVGSVWKGEFRTKNYAIIPVSSGGALESIVDLQNGNYNLFTTEKYKIGELYDFAYDGKGAGENLYIWQPHDGQSQIYAFGPWRCVETGPVRTAFETTAEHTSHGKASLKVIAYEKKIDFDLSLEMDDAPGRQLRLMFPVNAGKIFDDDGNFDHKTVKVQYDVPFGEVTVGDEVLKKFSRFNDQSDPNGVGLNSHPANPVNSGIRPREIQNWIGVSDDRERMNIKITSFGVSWDYQDALRTEHGEPEKTPVLQPVLLSTSESCNREVDHWLQPGIHRYHFSITSGTADNVASRRDAVAANYPLKSSIQIQHAPEAFLPDTFCGIDPKNDNVVITAVKRSEDNAGSVILRYYESEGNTTGTGEIAFSDKISILSAETTNLLEEPDGNSCETDGKRLFIPVRAWGIGTVKLTLRCDD